MKTRARSGNPTASLALSTPNPPGYPACAYDGGQNKTFTGDKHEVLIS